MMEELKLLASKNDVPSQSPVKVSPTRPSRDSRPVRIPGCRHAPAREEARTRSGTPQGPQRGAGERQ